MLWKPREQGRPNGFCDQSACFMGKWVKGSGNWERYRDYICCCEGCAMTQLFPILQVSSYLCSVFCTPETGNAKSTSFAKCFFHSYTSNRLAYCCFISAQYHSRMTVLFFSPRKMTCSNVQKINNRCKLANCGPNGVSGHLQSSEKFEPFSVAYRYAYNSVPSHFRVINCHLVMRET